MSPEERFKNRRGTEPVTLEPELAYFSPRKMKHWNLTTLREKLIRIRVKVLVPGPRRSP